MKLKPDSRPEFPYPGLRPFRQEEAEIFFGREEQIEGLLEKLEARRFLAVVGPSGCGKSSLVYAGMLPALEQGFMLSAGDRWRFAVMRPGASPMEHLAGALYEALKQEPDEKEKEAADVRETGVAFLSAALRRGPLGIVQAFQEARLPKETRLLVLADQFEEIFRYRDQGDVNEAEAFVNLLLQASQAPDVPVYTALTMRSDFLGDCALFMGLPEAMNDSQFLTPRLTREQRRAAITGPAGIFDTAVEPELVNRLLNDMGADPDQLPLLQHCLMRMWNFAAEAGQDVLTLPLYRRNGGIEHALSRHANKIYKELHPKKQRIAVILFKCLSERAEGKRDTRRPVRLSEPATVADVDVADVLEVIEVFRGGNRSFLNLSQEEITGETVVDISHESLIRKWDKLQFWVEEEAESAEIYRRLETSARLWKAGKEALLIPPGLDVALEWREREQPTKAWAARYGEDYDLVLEYLTASERAHQEKIEAEKARQQEKLNNARRQLAFALVGLFIAIALAVWGFWERGRADQARDKAVQTEQQRTTELFESHLTHASLQARMEDYEKSREILKKTYDLDKDIPPARRHARNLMVGYADLMGGQADKVYEGAGAQLQNVAVSPDGKTLAAVGERGSVLLFDEESGEVVKRLEGHEEKGGSGSSTVRAVVFHPDGNWLATAGDDRRIILWSMPEGEKQREWEASNRVDPLIVSPDGKSLVSGGWDYNITFWDTETGEPIKTLEGHESKVSGLAFSPDGTLLASASYDRTARVWDVESGEVVHVLRGHTAQVQGVVFHPESNILASSGADKYIILWDLESGNPISVFRGHTNYLTQLLFIDKGQKLISASHDRTLRIWDTDTGVTLRVLQGHQAGVIGLAANGHTLYSAATDGTVRRWDARMAGEHGEMRVVDLPEGGISSCISPDGSKIAVGLYSGGLLVFSLPNFEVYWKIDDAHNDQVLRLAFDPEGKLLVSSSHDSTLKVWNIVEKKHLHTYEGHGSSVHAVAFSPDGKSIASASYDDRIGWFEVEGEKEGKFFEAHSGDTRSVAFDTKGKTLLSAGADGEVYLWNIQSWPPKRIKEFPMPKEITIWAALSPDGTRIAAVGRDFVIRIFNTRTGKAENAFVGHEQTVYRAEFSPDGGQVATAGGDSTIRLWDLETNSELFTINLPAPKPPPAPLWDFSFRTTPTGDCLIAVPLTRGKLVVYRFKGVYR